MNKQLFRQQSMDHISSPEQMHDYMRVTSPRLWMLLSAILALLVGLVVYASTTRMENTMSIRLQAGENYGTCDLTAAQKDMVKTQMPVRLGDVTGYVSDIMQVTMLRLDAVFDGTPPVDDYYVLTFGDSLPSGPAEEDENTTYVVIIDGTMYSYGRSEELRARLAGDTRVRVGGKLATVTGCELCEMVSITVMFDDGTRLPGGVYDAEIVLESTAPISFLTN